MNLIKKYTPTCLNDLVIPNQNVKNLFEDIVNGLSSDRCLYLVGTQGAQKSTFANMLPKLIEGFDPHVNIINGFDKLDIKEALTPIRNIVNFGGISGQKYQYVIFEEIDKVENNLSLFWQLMDGFTSNIFVIATSNSLMSTDKSVRSRFKVVEMEPITSATFLPRAIDILNSEGIGLNHQYILDELKDMDSLNDIRKYMNVLCDIERDHLAGRIHTSEYGSAPIKHSKPKLTVLSSK
jgi:predicted AAA+ superfamily ATPase